MKITEHQFYSPDADWLEEFERNNEIPQRTNIRDLVPIYDGDGEMLGMVRWDAARELCKILNTYN